MKIEAGWRKEGDDCRSPERRVRTETLPTPIYAGFTKERNISTVNMSNFTSAVTCNQLRLLKSPDSL